MIDLSRRDWRERIRHGQSLLPDLDLDPDAVRRALGIFNRLRLPDVIGQPAMEEAAGDWFRAIVAAVFGTAREGTLPREVREFFVLVPKKSSKTSGGAAIMLTALLLNRRPRAEFLLIGPTQDVAKLAYSQAVGMIEADPEGFLQKRFHVRDHLKEIVDRKTQGGAEDQDLRHQRGDRGEAGRRPAGRTARDQRATPMPAASSARCAAACWRSPRRS